MAMITIDQLNKTETLEKVQEIAQDYIIHEAMPEAWNLINKIEGQIRGLIDSSPEIYKQYLKILVQLKFVAIPFQTDDQIFELIRKFFLTALKEGLDIERRIRVYLASKSVFNRDQFKKDILTSLKQNQEKIENKTIGEWLLGYDGFAGARKNTSIERTKFITQNPEASKLSEESKQLLSKLLEFYDNLKITVPLPIIGVSEITLSEFFEETGIPSLEEEEKKAALSKIIPLPPKEPLKEREVPEIPKEIKPKKPGLFEKLFGKKEEKPEELEEIEKIEEAPKKISVYEEKISPYEKKRRFPITEKEIPTFPEEAKEKEIKKIEEVKEAKPQSPLPKLQYKIRTMKQDIEKAKKEPIPKIEEL